MIAGGEGNMMAILTGVLEMLLILYVLAMAVARR